MQTALRRPAVVPEGLARGAFSAPDLPEDVVAAGPLKDVKSPTLIVSPEVGNVGWFGSRVDISPLRGSKAMARDGPRTQTEKKQKHPITTTIQDFLTIDFISLPPFLRAMGLKKDLYLQAIFPLSIFILPDHPVWRNDLTIKLEPLKEDLKAMHKIRQIRFGGPPEGVQAKVKALDSDTFAVE